MHIDQTIQALCKLGLDRLDAQMLLLHALHKPTNNRAWLLAHSDDDVPDDVQLQLAELALRRARGEPLAYVTGHKEFYGLDLLVDARVLDPRADTETLVEWALECMPATDPVRAIDLGTGSGAIALALQHQRPGWQVHALDYSSQALSVAQANAARLQLPVLLRQGAWLDGVQERFHLIVSNPPYIAAQDPHLQALQHEPLQALASGADGLHDIRRIIAQAPACLEDGGWLLLEHGYDQAEAVRSLLRDAGFAQVQSRRDLAGIERCSGGCRNAHPIHD